MIATPEPKSATTKKMQLIGGRRGPMTDLYRIKELEWEQVGKVLQAALGFSSYTLVVIDGEWVLKRS